MEELGNLRTVTVHYVDGAAKQDFATQVDADFALAKSLQAQEESQFVNAAFDFDAFGVWASSSSVLADVQRLKSGLQLKRDEALARALEDSDDQEQLMIMLSLQEQQQAHPVDRNITQDSVDPDAMTYEELIGLTEALGGQNRGLTPEEVKMLSVKKYRRCCFQRSKDEYCVICQQQYKRGDSIIPLPICKHKYHKMCIRKWLEIKKSCPICNLEVVIPY